jgi:hypothetical protein
MHASGDPGDHIVPSKIDHGPLLLALKSDAAAENPKINFREIFNSRSTRRLFPAARVARARSLD